MSREITGLVMVNYPKNPYILYEIRSENKKDLGIYIGVTQNYLGRCYAHSKQRKYKENNNPLYTWMNDVIENQGIKVRMKIIEEGYNEKEAFQREKELIWLYRWNGFNVLNISDGGKGNFGSKPWNKGIKNPYTEEQLKVLSESHLGQIGHMKGKNHSQKTKDLIKLKNKERKENGWVDPRTLYIYKYDRNGTLLNTYFGLKEAGLKEQVNPTSIGEWCRKEKKPRNKFIWSYTKLA